MKNVMIIIQAQIIITRDFQLSLRKYCVKILGVKLVRWCCSVASQPNIASGYLPIKGLSSDPSKKAQISDTALLLLSGQLYHYYACWSQQALTVNQAQKSEKSNKYRRSPASAIPLYHKIDARLQISVKNQRLKSYTAQRQLYSI